MTLPPFIYEFDSLQFGDVLQRVPGNGHQIGVFTFLDRPDLVFHPIICELTKVVAWIASAGAMPCFTSHSKSRACGPVRVEIAVAKVPTGAASKTGLWVPELKRYYSAVPKHFVLTPPHGSMDIRADLLKELSLSEGMLQPIFSNLIVEEAHLMVFDYLP